MTVPQLCECFQSSPATIRRDLRELAEKRLLLRNRNGAVPYQGRYVQPSVHFRAAVHAREKDRIAKTASYLIADDMLLFIDSSSTCLSLVNYLGNRKNLTIVTNSLQLLTLMRDSPHHLILTGGSYYAPSHAFYGAMAVRSIMAYNFDLAFISSVAITPDGFAAETLEHSVFIRKAALFRAKETVLLCDSSKIGLRRPFNIASVREMHYVFTDKPELLKQLNIPTPSESEACYESVDTI
jgi:DeoR/GlpR family transcriptional regulator of sugar metabolism